MWNDDSREWLHGDSLHTVEPEELEENNFDLIYKVIAEMKRDLKNGNDIWVHEMLSSVLDNDNERSLNNILTDYLGEV